VLDAERTALLVIDVQRALFSRPTPIYKADNLIHNLNSLIEMWQYSGGLVVYIQHSNNKMLIKNSIGWQFHPDLTVRKTDVVIHKVPAMLSKKPILMKFSTPVGSRIL
jgi:nicotinamidase-related amidase